MLTSRWGGGLASLSHGWPPNMRLKLTGLSLLRESEGCALTGTGLRPLPVAPAGGSPAA
jgi:hypothetical protein